MCKDELVQRNISEKGPSSAQYSSSTLPVLVFVSWETETPSIQSVHSQKVWTGAGDTYSIRGVDAAWAAAGDVNAYSVTGAAQVPAGAGDTYSLLGVGVA